jgi:hypothetical protein
MKTLKSLTFAAANLGQQTPALARRQKLIAHLEEQIALARDPQHIRVQHRWVIQDDGAKTRLEEQKRVRRWWRFDQSGKVYLTVRYGSKAIEFERGKTAIVLADESKLIDALETVMAATKAGELDDQLSHHAKLRGLAKAKKAA